MKIQFTIPGTPVAKARPRVTRSGHAYTPKKTADYEMRVKICVMQLMAVQRLRPTTEAVRLTVQAFFPIPASWTKAKKEKALNGDLKHTTKPDLSNIVKAVEDAMNGIVYKDDSQISEIVCVKRYSMSPKVDLTVEVINEKI